jgi:hypothetical protein
MRMDKDVYYQRICELAEFVGAEQLDIDDPRAHVVDEEPETANSGGCGSGCGCH